jgi:hypothetical protein
MLFRATSNVLMLLVAAAGLAAQSVPVRGPVAGVVFDGHARAIRPMLGIPGGSYLGDALAGSIDLAGISPDGKLALAAADGNLFLLRGLDTGAPRWTRLAQAAANPDRIAWNRTSTAAAVCSGGRLRLWRDLDETPPATVEPDSNPRAASRRLRSGAKLTPRATDLGDLSALGGRVTALAVDAAGAVLAGVEDTEAGGLYRLSSESEPVLLARLTSPGGIVFANADNDLFVSDRGRQEILEIRDFRDGADVPVRRAVTFSDSSDRLGFRTVPAGAAPRRFPVSAEFPRGAGRGPPGARGRAEPGGLFRSRGKRRCCC